ncbi:hypothetical protein HYV49_04745 [Candidatus Pacearchaeota archaeon]|nr:hypothetical protein [Candidatus Pacearchaeota archaeon]
MTEKIRTINLFITPASLKVFFSRFRGEKTDYDFSSIAELRHLLSNEKARLLHTIKTKNPDSIYHLAKLLGRGFKSVYDDIMLFKRFGFIELKQSQKGNRKSLKPVIALDRLQLILNI